MRRLLFKFVAMLSMLILLLTAAMYVRGSFALDEFDLVFKGHGIAVLLWPHDVGIVVVTLIDASRPISLTHMIHPYTPSRPRSWVRWHSEVGRHSLAVPYW